MELCIRGLTPQATNTYIYIHTWQWISWVTPWARTWALMIHLLDKPTQKRGKWDWVLHHYSEPKLPSPRLRQDHSWSMPTRGHKSRLIPRYPASPHPPHPGPWPTRTGLLHWLTTIQQGQMNPSCRESEAGHRTITRNPYCPVQDCGRTTYGRCPPEGTNLTGYPASPYHLQLRTQASTHRTTLARLDSRQTTPRRTDTDMNDIIRTKVK